MRRWLAALALSATAVIAHASERAELAWQHINHNDAVIIDVRTPQEFHQAHLNNAYNLPYDSIQRTIKPLQLDSNQPIVVYCRSGNRSGIALQTLVQMGFTNVVNGGGLMEMQAAK